MVGRNVQVPMYQARIPIGGGGGNIDLRERPGDNPIFLALQQIIEQKRQRKQDVLKRRTAESQIAYRQKATEQMGQQQPVKGIIVRGENTIKLINPYDGSEITDLGPPPKGEKANKALDAIIAMGKISGAAGKIPTESLEQPIIDEAIASLRGPLMEQLDLEEVPGREVRRTEPHWYLPGFMEDWLAPDITAAKGGKVVRKRKRVESKAVEPITATNPKTGKRIVSYDGGKTWQSLK